MELTKKYRVNNVIRSMLGAKVNVGDILIVSGIRSTLGQNIDIEDFLPSCTPYFTPDEIRIRELEAEIAEMKKLIDDKPKRKEYRRLSASDKADVDKCIADGLSNPDIAKRFAVSESMVSRRRPKKTDTNNEAATDYVQGLGD